MGRLLLKIFLAYWLAAGIVIVISDFEPHRHIHNPELMDALNSALAINGRTMIRAYENGSCNEVQTGLSSARESLYLATPQGHLLCGEMKSPDIVRLVESATRQGKRITANYARFQLIAFPVTSAGGTRYVLLLKNSYSTALQVYGLLPGYTTISISCVVTLFLALLVALPIRRLRTAAGMIAVGKLDTRVHWTKPSASKLKLGDDDISLLVRDFNYMAEKLQQLTNAQRLLLRDVSHELRSPLTRLGVALGLARSEAEDSMKDHLYRIEVETGRLNDLISQILSLSQMEMVHELHRADLISLSELVVNLLPDVQYEANQSRCAISKDLGADCYLRGDASLLRETIENVLRNSIKYSPDAGEIHIETSAEQNSGTSFVKLCVRDNGPGIPETELALALKPFYRADRVRHWEKNGSGIGLAIADRTTKLHGGTISLRNRANGGLIVEMRFPAAHIP